MMHFYLNVYEIERFERLLQMMPNVAWVSRNHWGDRKPKQNLPSVNSQNKTPVHSTVQGREDMNHPLGTVGRAQKEVFRRLLWRVLLSHVVSFCVFSVTGFLITCTAVAVTRLPSSTPTPFFPKGTSASLWLFFCSLWPRGKSQNVHFWPRLKETRSKYHDPHSSQRHKPCRG